MHVLDTNRIDALAAHLDRRAAELADAAGRLRLRASQLSWHSPAADASAATATGLLELVGRCQRRCSDTATSLRQHRRTAAHRLATLSTVEHTMAKVARGLGGLL
jgi:putative protein kinase ArgK-like GTPase of G3E family